MSDWILGKKVPPEPKAPEPEWKAVEGPIRPCIQHRGINGAST